MSTDKKAMTFRLSLAARERLARLVVARNVGSVRKVSSTAVLEELILGRGVDVVSATGTVVEAEILPPVAVPLVPATEAEVKQVSAPISPDVFESVEAAKRAADEVTGLSDRRVREELRKPALREWSGGVKRRQVIPVPGWKK